MVFKHLTLARGRKCLDAQVNPGGSTPMRRDTMLNFNGDGDKPEACPFGDGSREDLALPPERLGHIDFAELRDRKEMPIDTKFIIVEVKRETVMLLALEMRETRICAIFALNAWRATPQALRK